MNQPTKLLMLLLMPVGLRPSDSLAQSLRLKLREFTNRNVCNTLQATLENTGTVPLSVVVGTSLGNGARLDMNQLTFEITSGRGEPREFRILQAGIVEGRTDPWIVSLPAHSLFRVTISTSDLYNPKTSRLLGSEVLSKIRAQLVGAPAVALDRNVGVESSNLQLLLTGTIHSNVLEKVSSRGACLGELPH
jgi:hypothetical protein